MNSVPSINNIFENILGVDRMKLYWPTVSNCLCRYCMQLAIMRGSKTTVEATLVHILFMFDIGIVIPVMMVTVKWR